MRVFSTIEIFAYSQRQKSTQIVYQSVKELTVRRPDRFIAFRFTTLAALRRSIILQHLSFPSSFIFNFRRLAPPAYSSAQLAAITPVTHQLHRRTRILLHPRSVSSALFSIAKPSTPDPKTTPSQCQVIVCAKLIKTAPRQRGAHYRPHYHDVKDFSKAPCRSLPL